MSLLKEQLEELEEELTADVVAISPYHDLPFAIFRYDPRSEFEMRKEVQLLVTRLKNKGKNVHIISLAELFNESIEKEGGVDAIVREEREFKFARAQQTVSYILSDPDFTPITSLLEDRLNKLDPTNAVVFLVHSGVFAPNCYRLSVLLDYMKGKTEIPCILFYPGSIKDNTLYFMDQFDQPPGSYHVTILNR